jgi:VanZ family protein
MGQVDSVEQAAQAPQAQGRARRTAPHWRTRGGRAARLMLRSLALLLLILCVLELLRLTFVPTPGSVAFAHTNLHPFATIRLYMKYGTVQQQIFQIGGNIAMGVALGFLLPQITPYLRGLIRVEIVTVVFAALVELVQHYFIAGSSLNVDDVILAAAGAALGYVPLGRMFGMRLYPDHLHWWQRMLARSLERRRARGGARAGRASRTGP